ncbi:MAG: glycosyltransferase family 2 protein [Candidatus Roizmanbacteria bacterium]
MLAIITVIYQNYTILDDFFASLSSQQNADFHIYIIDLTPRKTLQIITFPDKRYTLIRGENKGYAHGVNLGIKAAVSENISLFAVVNPDVVLDTHFVQSAKLSLQMHPGSIIGGKIYYAPGYEYHKRKEADLQSLSSGPQLSPIHYPLSNALPVYTIWYAGGRIDWAHATCHHIGVDDLDHPMYDQPMATDFVTGCCMIYDKSVVKKVGKWDEGYFMYYEDSDYCLRAKKKGIPVRYEPSIKLWHKNAQSTGGSGSDFHSKSMERSRMHFAIKYAPMRTKLHMIKNAFLSI